MAEDANRNLFRLFEEQDAAENNSDFIELQAAQPFTHHLEGEAIPTPVAGIQHFENGSTRHDVILTEDIFDEPSSSGNAMETSFEVRHFENGSTRHNGIQTHDDFDEPSSSVHAMETSFDILVRGINDLDEGDDENDDDPLDDVSSQGDDVASILDDSDPELEVEGDAESDDQDMNDTLRTALSSVAVGNLTSKDGTLWSEEPIVQNFRQRQCNIFRPVKSHVRNVNVKSLSDSLSVFSLFFTPMIILDIMKFTNIEGKRCRGDRWVETDEVELMALFGLFYHLGARKLNLVSVTRIWSGIAADPVARATMTMKRFVNLTTCLRFDNKDTRSARRAKDIFAPIRDIFDTINNKLARYYVPDMNLTVDEQLVPWRGRAKFLQFLPSKPDKYGLKLFWLCDSATSYPLKGIPYLGKYGERRTNLGRETVKELVVPYMKSGRNITFDNFFTDKELLLWLSKQGLTGVGTVRRDKRFIPEKFKLSKNLKRYESEFAFSSEMAMVSHKSNHKKNVIVLSSMHNSKDVEEGPKRKPEIVKYYNATKGAVDCFDQMCHSLTTKRKCRRWPMVIFYNLLDTVGISANIIYRDIFPRSEISHNRKRPEFQEDLARCLLTNHLHRRLAKLKKPNIMLELSIKHVCEVWKIQRPVYLDRSTEATTTTSSTPTSMKRKASKGRCLDCPRKKDSKLTQTCGGCGRFICKAHSKILCGDCK